MKRIFTLLLLLSICLSCTNRIDIDPFREMKSNLKGCVKSIEYTYTSFRVRYDDTIKFRPVIYLYKFDRLQNVIEVGEYKKVDGKYTGYCFLQQFKYDEDNLLKTCVYKTYKKYYRWENRYNKHQQLTEKDYFDSKGELIAEDSFQYDERGRLSQIDREEKPLNEKYYISKLTYTDSTIVHEKSTKSTNYKYEVYNLDGIMLGTNIIRCFGATRATLKRNERGLPIECIEGKMTARDRFTTDTSTRDKIYLYEYKYDEYGNWIERTEYCIEDNNKTISSKTTRDIVYFQ